MERNNKRKECPSGDSIEGTVRTMVDKGKYAFTGVGGDHAAIAVLRSKKTVSKVIPLDQNFLLPII